MSARTSARRLPRSAKVWILVVCTSAATVLLAVAASSLWQAPPLSWTVLAIIGFAAAMEWPVRGLTRTIGEPDPWTLLGAVIIWTVGLPYAVLAATIGLLGSQALDRAPWYKRAYKVASRTLAATAAATALSMVYGASFPQSPGAVEEAVAVAALVVGVLAWEVTSWGDCPSFG